MKYTQSLNLKKPDGTDNVLISDLNENMDIVDEAIYDIKSSQNGHSEKIASTETLGHIKVGENLKITNEGVLDVQDTIINHPQNYYLHPFIVEAKQDTKGVYNLTIPGVLEYKMGLRILLKLTETNIQAAAKINVNNLGEKYLIYQTYGAIPQNAGELLSGRVYECIFDGTYFTLLGVQSVATFETGEDIPGQPAMVASIGAVGKVNAKVDNRFVKVPVLAPFSTIEYLEPRMKYVGNLVAFEGSVKVVATVNSNTIIRVPQGFYSRVDFEFSLYRQRTAQYERIKGVLGRYGLMVDMNEMSKLAIGDLLHFNVVYVRDE